MKNFFIAHILNESKFIAFGSIEKKRKTRKHFNILWCGAVCLFSAVFMLINTINKTLHFIEALEKKALQILFNSIVCRGFNPLVYILLFSSLFCHFMQMQIFFRSFRSSPSIQCLNQFVVNND